MESSIPKTFRCYLVDRAGEGRVSAGPAERRIDELPEGDVLVRVAYSSLNYKDAMAATGHRGIVRRFPHVPGVDAAGTVVASEAAEFKPGDEVIVTGFDCGSTRWGGWSEYIRVPHEWVVPRPDDLSLREAMILGTAGLTAALCVDALQKHNVRPGSGKVVVTGATGGVGSVAVAILAKLGYDVAAVTGKAASHAYLTDLGARQILGREEMDDKSGRPLLSARFAGGVDTVGGNILGTLLRSACARRLCNRLRAGREQRTASKRLSLHFAPVTLTGIDAAWGPMRSESKCGGDYPANGNRRSWKRWPNLQR